VGTIDGGEEASVRTILKIWNDEPGPIFFLATRRLGRFEDHAFTRDDFDDLGGFVRDRVEQRCDVYWCCHSFYQRRRVERYAAPSKNLWCDLDSVDPRSLKYRPSVAWETSPGRFSSLWKLDSVPTKGLRRSFNAAIGGDNGGWIITKLLRVPGSRNLKYPQRPLVKLLWSDDTTYSAAKLEKEFGGGEDDRRPGGTITLVLDGLKWKDVLRRRGCMEILSEVTTPLWANQRRSHVIWKIGRTLAEHGATASEIAVVLLASKVWQSKWGSNLRALEREVGRMIGGD
jgi:hypothetical protein